MQRFEKELPKSVLKLIIKEIDKQCSEDNVDWTDDSPYEDTIADLLDGVLRKFGITDIDFESYGFFWKLYQENHNFDGTGDIVVPNIMIFPVDISIDVVKYGYEIYSHDIATYDKNYINSFVFDATDFDIYGGEYIEFETTDSETNDWKILSVGHPKPIYESKKVKRVLTENDQKELQKLLIMKKQIEKRINFLSS